MLRQSEVLRLHLQRDFNFLESSAFWQLGLKVKKWSLLSSLSILLFAQAYDCRFFAFKSLHSQLALTFLFQASFSIIYLIFVSRVPFFMIFKRLISAVMGLNKKEKYCELYSRTYY